MAKVRAGLASLPGLACPACSRARPVGGGKATLYSLGADSGGPKPGYCPSSLRCWCCCAGGAGETCLAGTGLALMHWVKGMICAGSGVWHSRATLLPWGPLSPPYQASMLNCEPAFPSSKPASRPASPLAQTSEPAPPEQRCVIPGRAPLTASRACTLHAFRSMPTSSSRWRWTRRRRRSSRRRRRSRRRRAGWIARTLSSCELPRDCAPTFLLAGLGGMQASPLSLPSMARRLHPRPCLEPPSSLLLCTPAHPPASVSVHPCRD